MSRHGGTETRNSFIGTARTESIARLSVFRLRLFIIASQCCGRPADSDSRRVSGLKARAGAQWTLPGPRPGRSQPRMIYRTLARTSGAPGGYCLRLTQVKWRY